MNGLQNLAIWDRRLIFPAKQQTANAMTTFHFDTRQEPDGTWTVVKLSTGEPAKLNGQFCCNLRRDEAQEIANYLNTLESDDHDVPPSK